jgi:hypothetical protein
LIQAETLSLGQAAWLAQRVLDGSSWLVGARPGGAGKTTVMSALLGLLPRSGTILLTNRDTGWEQSRRGDCVVAYEIGNGSYDAYVWGSQVRVLAGLGCAGVRVVSNLHADDLPEALSQLRDGNGVREEHLRGFGMFLPIAVSRQFLGARRRVDRVYLAGADGWQEVSREAATALAPAAVVRFLEGCLAAKVCDIGLIRRRWLDYTEARA